MALSISLKYYLNTYRLLHTTNRLFQGSPVIMAYTLREPRSLNEKMGKPLVILHGMMGSKQNWNSISLMLKNGLDHSREVNLGNTYSSINHYNNHNS